VTASLHSDVQGHDRPSPVHQFPGSTRCPAAARSFIQAALAVVPSDTNEVAQLLVSELVTNAVLHAGTSIVVEVRVDGERVRVAVQDLSTTFPQPRVAADDATRGRGLQLVDALSSSWGWELTAGGKSVWFEL
jgi:anti-sigma regulatory factor (Ser/Thr protein kinase)